ncbi:MAG: C4-type zinc ribbon domain-containing protein, partial [Thermodesulfobacteriota bacterium]|nr:C4-type zinc ribbon domain-containing protein [Thermodesulfobacteriota bacterium]
RVKESLAHEQEMNKRRRELESRLEEAEEKTRQNQTRQLQVKTNEEYRALLQENEYLRQTKSTQEDEVLDLMEKLEDIRAENKKLKVWLEDQKKVLAEKKKSIEEWLAQCVRDQESFNAKRPGLLGEIPKDFFRLYERLLKSRNNRAVVSIMGGICQECHMKIPPQQFNELQSNKKLMTCPHCGRIIYWGDHEDFSAI